MCANHSEFWGRREKLIVETGMTPRHPQMRIKQRTFMPSEMRNAARVRYPGHLALQRGVPAADFRLFCGRKP